MSSKYSSSIPRLSDRFQTLLDESSPATKGLKDHLEDLVKGCSIDIDSELDDEGEAALSQQDAVGEVVKTQKNDKHIGQVDEIGVCFYSGKPYSNLKHGDKLYAAPRSTAQEDSASYIEDHAKHLLKVSEKMAKTLNEGGRMEIPKHWQKVPFRIEKLSDALSELSDEQKHEAINDLCSQLGIDRNPSYADFNSWIKLHLKSPDNCGHYMIDAEELRQFINTGVVDK